ncbi:hypothetical protein [Mucilaginibacter aquaedulcis]|uniref:hypothetical protein n=1 Tax=Mucilaginibacter aquaedulcis TaxID=1187081 RepID=UPI0025B2E833|nr:hypothetical protein [Mucilaginibacter aquaedulcis]MDN3548892.1 hypothetical protein [Mucilaginibacter aquaedulcis]
MQDAKEKINDEEQKTNTNPIEYVLIRYKDWPHQKNRAENQIFYAVRELEKLGIKGIDKRPFNQEEVNDLIRKINALLIKIDELTVGQEIIFDFITELKNDLGELRTDFPLGKKRWYQRFTGILGSYVANKGADAIFDALKPEIARIVQEQGHKLLNI